MRSRKSVLLSLALACGSAAWAAPVATKPDAKAAEGHFATLGKYCGDCHNATDWAGGLAFDTLAADSVPAALRDW